MSAIGDIILTLPVAEALKKAFPAARLDFVIKKEFADLVSEHPAIEKLWEFDRASGFAGLREMAACLREEKYDLVVDLHGNLRSTYIRGFSGARMRRVYRKKTGSRLALKHLRINALAKAPPVADRYFTALEDFGITRNGAMPVLHLGEQAVASARRILAEEGIGDSSPYLALAPGASHPTKRWPATRFAEAAAEIAGSDGAAVLLGSSSDREMAGEAARELAKRGVKTADLTGRTALMETAAVIAGADLLLTNDTGLMHMGDALGRPLAAVFGPTSRELGFYPLGASSIVVEAEGLDCRPCTLHGDESCPKGHHRCMLDLTAGQVAEAAKSALALAQSRERVGT